MSNRFSGVGEYMGKQVNEFKALKVRVQNLKYCSKKAIIFYYFLDTIMTDNRS